MSQLDALIKNYEHHVALPWGQGRSPSERVWFLIYDKIQERSILHRLEEFELRTKQAGHGWHLIDVTDAFPQWMASQDHAEAYFRNPQKLSPAVLRQFREDTLETLRKEIGDLPDSGNVVVALKGVASFFGLIKVSEIVHPLAEALAGRLLVFFPGVHDNNNYRLLDARDGWNYLAIPITDREEGFDS